MNGAPIDRVKPEPDVEEEIPRFVASTSGVPASVEFVDLTNDEYFSEFKSFLDHIKDHRTQATKKRTPHPKHVSDVIALQVAHVQLISFYQELYICSLFGIDFRNVMIYGRIIPGTVKYENNTQIYKLDDGSGIVEVYYAHGLKRDLDNLTAVNSCENIVTTRTPLNEEQVPKDPQQLADLKLLLALVKSRCQQRLQYFPLGTRCFAIGRPFMNRHDRVSIYAHSMYADQDTSGRSAEIFWKTHLALCYEQRTTGTHKSTSLQQSSQHASEQFTQPGGSQKEVSEEVIEEGEIEMEELDALEITGKTLNDGKSTQQEENTPKLLNNNGKRSKKRRAKIDEIIDTVMTKGDTILLPKARRHDAFCSYLIERLQMLPLQAARELEVEFTVRVNAVLDLHGSPCNDRI